jgi:hypothetical protein
MIESRHRAALPFNRSKAMSKQEHRVQWLFVFDIWLAIWVLAFPPAPHSHAVMNYPPAIQMHGEP